MESDTPRTDAENWIRDMGFEKWVSIDFARELERELAAAKAELSAMRQQRDEAQRDAQRYRWLKSKGCDWVTIYRHPSGDEIFDGKGDAKMDERIDAARTRDEEGGGA